VGCFVTISPSVGCQFDIDAVTKPWPALCSARRKLQGSQTEPSAGFSYFIYNTPEIHTLPVVLPDPSAQSCRQDACARWPPPIEPVMASSRPRFAICPDPYLAQLSSLSRWPRTPQAQRRPTDVYVRATTASLCPEHLHPPQQTFCHPNLRCHCKHLQGTCAGKCGAAAVGLHLPKFGPWLPLLAPQQQLVPGMVVGSVASKRPALQAEHSVPPCILHPPIVVPPQLSGLESSSWLVMLVASWLAGFSHGYGCGHVQLSWLQQACHWPLKGGGREGVARLAPRPRPAPVCLAWASRPDSSTQGHRHQGALGRSALAG
jgi:hypothetical protein